MISAFENYDFSDFWDDNDYSIKEYLDETPSSSLIDSIEKELGYKLPASYIELMKLHNGGIVQKSCFPTKTPTSWADNHIAINGIFGIGRKKTYSLCGEIGSQFMIDEWGYPDMGVYICNTPSAGHDMIMLDYRKCGNHGNPEVVHVDQELNYKITFLANTFEDFILGLVHEDVFDTSEDDLKNDLHRIENGQFSPLLSRLIDNQHNLDWERIIRNICKKLTIEKGYFALHADELSYLLYDIQFYLCSKLKKVKSQEKYLQEYPSIIALCDAEFSTKGFAPDFVKNWIKERISNNQITKKYIGGLVFNTEYQKALMDEIKKYS